MSFYTDAWWQHFARNEHVAVIVGTDAPKFMTLVEFAEANREVLDEMVSNAEGHDVTAQIFTGDDLMLGGGAASVVRVTSAVKCKRCSVVMLEWANSEGCEDPDCHAQEHARAIERIMARPLIKETQT